MGGRWSCRAMDGKRDRAATPTQWACVIVPTPSDRAGWALHHPGWSWPRWIMESAMPDEVASQALIVDQLLQDVFDLLAAMDLNDETLKEHPRYAVQRSAIDMFNFIIAASRHRRDLSLAPPNSDLPGAAVRRLVIAFTDLDKGIVDPVLAPMADEGARR